MTKFAGRWITTYGPMELQQDAKGIRGTYWFQGTIACSIEGQIRDGRFFFVYKDPSGTGQGWFDQPRYGQLSGRYCPQGLDRWEAWNGHREWDGIWDTMFGRIRLFQEVDCIHGIYEGMGPSRIEGRLEGKRFVFRYIEPAVQGDGWFELTDDALSFTGKWRPEGADGWGDWQGRRVFPVQGLTWMVVLEAHWQRSFADGEFSYGEMLQEFFARLPHVAFRQRFFNDGASLERWCREMAYLVEPVIVLISSHGLSDGVTVGGQTIDTKKVIESLRLANNVKLLHFATCLMLKEEKAGDFAKRIGVEVPYPISGYATSIDWGGSAVLEFGYFDMILSKGLTPDLAARLLPSLITYAGDQAPAESPYPAVGFRFIPPTRG